jgi:transposase InsO family protein
VKRVLKRHACSRYSRWKKWHTYPPRPLPEKPGILVQIDTMMDGIPEDQLSVYALIDVCSRWAYVLPTPRVNCLRSLDFVTKANKVAPFDFKTLQSDHGSEFSKWFTRQLIIRGLEHRHSRVRKPTDNGHIERFIRTLQEECLSRVPRSLNSWQKEIPEYLKYYNTERPHMGINMRTPIQVVTSY